MIHIFFKGNVNVNWLHLKIGLSKITPNYNDHIKLTLTVSVVRIISIMKINSNQDFLTDKKI